jgi:hypothetical protein
MICDFEHLLRPGDIAITKTLKGHSIARNSLRNDISAPYWHHIAVISSFEDAADFARMIVARDGVRAWVRKSEEELEPLRD